MDAHARRCPSRLVSAQDLCGTFLVFFGLFSFLDFSSHPSVFMAAHGTNTCDPGTSSRNIYLRVVSYLSTSVTGSLGTANRACIDRTMHPVLFLLLNQTLRFFGCILDQATPLVWDPRVISHMLHLERKAGIIILSSAIC